MIGEPQTTEWEPEREIKDERIDWHMTYDDGKEEDIFEEELALALMLLNEVIFLNSNWWEEDWPQKARDAPCFCVNCNDVFAWGSADAESLPYAEIENLYRMWRKDPAWGTAIWCMIQRREMPQKPVEDLIRKASIWDLDSLNLNVNATS